MPFSRYQIRNEFSLADPELYKAADKDDPEALLEGVAMAGLVGVLRQLGDLAEFAAEIFHDLHEEVMVTATRGHGLLVRVQQLESDFPSIERAFLSQTGHSAFFSSSGVGWHPNLRMEQNLITRGDLPRFVMDSYEECRAPPRLFLLDKFDIAGAGACLKRYTDPSFYKVEASSYEMMSTESQRDKKTRKTKKKGSQWKNGNTPEAFQPSHVKLHQLLLEERIQNGASEPARRVKLKKRKSKFPFDMENGKGYMEKLLNSPPEDKLVHEVPLKLHTDNSSEPGLETFEISMVDSSLGLTLTTENRSPYESPSVDKMVSREHMDNLPENVPERSESVMPTSGGVRFETEDEEVEEKHISVNGIEDGYDSDDVASEVDNYEDALATMESEIETDAELRANSDPSNPSVKQEMSSDANLEQLQSQSLGSESDSDDESSLIRKKITSFSYSDDTTTTSVDSSQAFACIEIPFRPRVSALPMDQEANFKESTSKDSDSSEIPLNNCLDVNNPKKTEELPAEPEAIIASTSEPCEQDKDDGNSDSTLVISREEEQSLGPFLEELDICEADMKPNEATINGDACSSPKEQLIDDLLECKSDSLEAGISHSGENEAEFENRKTALAASESKVATSADDSNGDLYNLEEKTELKDREPESVISETKDIDFSENKDLSTCENPELDGKEVEEDEDEDEAVTFAVEKNEENGLPTAELVIDESEVVQNSKESVESESLNQVDHIEKLEKVLVEEKVDQPHIPSFLHSESMDSQKNVDQETPFDSRSEKVEKFQDSVESTTSVIAVSEEPSVLSLSQSATHINFSDQIEFPSAPVFSGYNMLPQLAPINLDEMPPLPPLPPMQWRMGKPQNGSMISKPDGGQHEVNPFPSDFPQIESHPPLDSNQKAANEKAEYETLPAESSSEQIVPQPPFNGDRSQNVSTSGREIFWPSSGSSLPSVDDDERPNGIRPMKVQRSRTPLIDAVAAHDKSKLRKVSERARPVIPKEEEKDTLLEQIRAKSFNLKPAVQTRPSIQGPTTNLRVAAILEKANAIRQAFAGSDDDDDDDDEDGDDDWSDS